MKKLKQQLLEAEVLLVEAEVLPLLLLLQLQPKADLKQ
jgi:hypothetical protein